MHKIHSFVKQFLVSSVFIVTITPVWAQIAPDNTLGVEASQFNTSTLVDRIDGGAIRGNNLFHSFSEFNINEGQRVDFINPSGIKNIFTRVTGGSASSILGTLGVDGDANLFIINPNGIFFGKNAQLNVRGSFVGTTANSIQFGNQGIFSATTPTSPGLLTVNPSALLFNQINANAVIQNTSRVPVDSNMSGLRVPDSKSFLLVGGNVVVDGGGIFAIEGNIHLAGLAAPGNIGLNIVGDNFSLTIPDDIKRANISLKNNAEVNVRGSNNGNIKIYAHDVNLIQDSKIRAGIEISLGTPDSQGGDVTINATGTTTITDGSFIANRLQERAFGKTGNVNIVTENLILSNGGNINTSNYGTGNTGNTNIDASGDVLITEQKDSLASGISSFVFEGAIGNGGSINIKSESLTISKEAFLATGTFSQGNSGNISLQVSNGVELSRGFIYSNIGNRGVGNSGGININAGSLSLTDSSQIQSRIENINNTFGIIGNAGDININVNGYVRFSKPRPGEVNGIISQVDQGSFGNGANVTINANSFSLLDGSEIQGSIWGKGNSGNITINARDNILLNGRNVSTFSRIINSIQPDGEGNAGSIQIKANTLNVENGALISSSNLGGKGNAGNIAINVSEIINLDMLGRVSSDIGRDAVGNGGKISIKTGSLSLANGSQISSNVLLGKGNAGDITIEALDNITLNGVFSNLRQFLGLELDIDSVTTINSDLLGGVGKAGNIKILTPSLSVSNGASISSTSSGKGDAGNITINASDSVSLVGFGGKNNLYSQVSSYVVPQSIGNGGDIRINSGNLLIKDGGIIGANNGGEGNGGNIFLDVLNTTTFDGVGGSGFSSSANTFANNGNAGNIYLKTGSLFLTNGGTMSSQFLGGKGNAGSIIINARDVVKLDGVVKANFFDGRVFNTSSSLNTALASGAGNAGNIEITTGSLFVSNGASLFSATNGRGNAGNIIINAYDTVTFDAGKDGLFTLAGSSALSNSTGNGGDIRVNANSLFVNNGASFSALSSGSGNAGNIFINTRDVVVFDGDDGKSLPSSATTFASGRGNGGNIELQTGTLKLTNSGQLSTNAKTNAGNVNINARDAVIVDGIKTTFQSGIFTNLSPGGIGQGGDIQVTTDSLTLSNGGQFNTSSFGQGNAGNVLVNVRDTVLVEGTLNKPTSGIFTTLEEKAEGQGGDIHMNVGSLFMNGSGRISTSTLATGKAGDITINARGAINLDGKGRGDEISGILSSAFTGTNGNAGNTNIKAKLVRISNSSGIGAVTTAGAGGNIFLDIDDFLVLRNGSFISTTAGIQQVGGDGGNITINTPFIVALPNKNSDITANAYTGKGGQININTQGLFGITARTTATDITNDITASSQLGIPGQVNVTQLDTNPAKGINELPKQVIDVTQKITQTCPRTPEAISQMGKFTVTGRGSLPPSPLEVLSGRSNNLTLAALDETTVNNEVSKNVAPLNSIVEAQAWVKDADGNITLVTQAPATPSLPSVNCSS